MAGHEYQKNPASYDPNMLSAGRWTFDLPKPPASPGYSGTEGSLERRSGVYPARVSAVKVGSLPQLKFKLTLTLQEAIENLEEIANHSDVNTSERLLAVDAIRTVSELSEKFESVSANSKAPIEEQYESSSSCPPSCSICYPFLHSHKELNLSTGGYY